MGKSTKKWQKLAKNGLKPYYDLTGSTQKNPRRSGDKSKK